MLMLPFKLSFQCYVDYYTHASLFYVFDVSYSLHIVLHCLHHKSMFKGDYSRGFSEDVLTRGAERHKFYKPIH